ncbi:hypothetical protein D3870_04390 [Noviherbaspirillum cavernae]|uniref:Uncharacterized protein n=1 Tax=Noviherbaspirillum cavernae TaxID=2320862 RepID=A0A418WYM9_9BURK|nr:hypothetical protein [Noviherbaspirillum cavernae]RJG05359.1 hypothetical protein D3870_04390 [Noviherbaspirillum cavernae]
MSLELIRAAARTELDDNLHLGRLLVLLAEVDRGKGRPVEGITKLAKLDFLLRYPMCLERALSAADRRPELAKVDPHERTTIEAKMVRFKYGPWDSRYRRWLGLLAARGLVDVFIKGRTVNAKLSPAGIDVAYRMEEQESFTQLKERAKLISTVFGSMSGTRLKDFIYETFPELTSMKWGEEITL